MSNDPDSHWLNHTPQRILADYNKTNDTSYTLLLARLFVFREPCFLTWSSPPEPGYYDLPQIFSPRPTSGETEATSTETIQELVINDLDTIIDPELLLSTQFQDYWFREPLAFRSRTATSRLMIMIVLRVSGDEEAESKWVSFHDAMNEEPEREEGRGATKTEIAEAFARLQFSSRRVTIQHEFREEEADKICTQILTANIAVDYKSSSKTCGYITGGRWRVDSEAPWQFVLMLFRKTPPQLQMEYTLPESVENIEPKTTLGRWVDGNVEWTVADLKKRGSWWRKIMAEDGSLDFFWL